MNDATSIGLMTSPTTPRHRRRTQLLVLLAIATQVAEDVRQLLRDSMMLWEETTRSLFPADLFIQPGDQPPVIRENLSSAMCELYRHVGIFAHEDPVRRVVDRVERMQPEWVHAMHGGTHRAGLSPLRKRAPRTTIRV